jgi:hypothetical protein
MYMLGSRMVESYPHVPLVDGLGLNIALLSCEGKLCWGFNADYDLVPDLRDFVAAIDASFRELAGLAHVPSIPRGANGHDAARSA